MALQEPPINAFGQATASKDWYSIYPTPHNNAPDKTRSMMLISARISTDSWSQVDFPSSDVTAIQVKGDWGTIEIINIYNDGNSNETIAKLNKHHRDRNKESAHRENGGKHTLWLGDFNRHHPHWDDPGDVRLFTREAIKESETLIEAVAEAGLVMMLPSGIPTHLHNVTKRWSRLDNVFLSEHSENLLISCDTYAEHRGIRTDHIPILTELNLRASVAEETASANFREVDWEEFGKSLEQNLAKTQPAVRIQTQRQLDKCCESLTKAIQETIEEQVPITRITPKSKRWWTKELMQLRKQAGKLGRQSFNLRDEPEHEIHAAHKETAKRYERTLEYTKKQHWRDWLERAEDPDIWTVHKLISTAPTDGGKARIPTLRHKVGDEELTASTNSQKSAALAKCFFPAGPRESTDRQKGKRTKERKVRCKITREQIQDQLRKLKPYKAPGPDGIPNIVLTKNAPLLSEWLLPIYEAMYERNLLYKPWKSFTTVVLRKPGKPRYDVPKAYRPIALLNTMWKVLTALVADQLAHITEKYRLLPENHFGGRPGRTTTDAMHLLTHTIKKSWRARKVTSVLFLDIEGAFPNAVPAKLVRNLRKRGVPRKITNFVHSMLRGRITTLKFDGYTSDQISIENGIGQGDPLSMIVYQYYNADLLEIPNREGEAAIAYVDDTIMTATANTFEEAHDMLSDMMTREGGVAEWSADHNSPLEYSKLALIDFAHSTNPAARPAMTLPQGEINPTESTKYLGVIFDQHLSWKTQHAHAMGKGSKWAAQIRRIARPSWGITPRYARRLFISVALPRTLYAADVWSCTNKGEIKGQKGTAKVIKQLRTTQRAGALAITGGLRTSPTDALDAIAHLLPAELTLDKWLHKAAVRMTTLPPGHPLYKVIANKNTRKSKRHKSPLNYLMAKYGYDAKQIEKIPVTAVNPVDRGKTPFTIRIAEDREESIREAERAQEEIQIYADGSAVNGKVGAAAILLRAGNPPRVLHAHLGSEREHTVHEAELVGILLGLQLIKTEKRANKPCMLGVDNQAAIKAFKSNLRSPGHHLAREALRIAGQIQKSKKKTKYALTIRWTAGHEGIEGNEAADAEAKKAAEGHSSEKHLLPAYLRKPLLINPAAIKRTYHDSLKNSWTENWRQSPRGRKMRRTDKSTPSARFINAISSSKINRETASRIAQLKLKHIPLNTYLKRIGRAASTRCPACGAEEETIDHFLLDCPNYAHERWALNKQAVKIGKQLTMDTIIGEQEMLEALARYIEATHRFAQNGEQTHNTN